MFADRAYFPGDGNDDQQGGDADPETQSKKRACTAHFSGLSGRTPKAPYGID
jgi:hypothetical protein